jgi:hypothetical protein
MKNVFVYACIFGALRAVCLQDCVSQVVHAAGGEPSPAQQSQNNRFGVQLKPVVQQPSQAVTQQSQDSRFGVKLKSVVRQPSQAATQQASGVIPAWAGTTLKHVQPSQRQLPPQQWAQGPSVNYGSVDPMAGQRNLEINELVQKTQKKEAAIRESVSVFDVFTNVLKKTTESRKASLGIIGLPPEGQAASVLNPTIQISQYKSMLVKETGIVADIELGRLQKDLFSAIGGLDVVETAYRSWKAHHATIASSLFAGQQTTMLLAFHRVFENLLAKDFAIRSEEITPYISANQPDHIKLLALYSQKNFWESLYRIMVHFGGCLKTNQAAAVAAFNFAVSYNPTATYTSNPFIDLFRGVALTPEDRALMDTQEFMIGLNTAIKEGGKVIQNDYKNLSLPAQYVVLEADHLDGKLRDLKGVVAKLEAHMNAMKIPSANSLLLASPNNDYYVRKFGTHFRDQFRFDLYNASILGVETVISALIKNLTDAVEIFKLCNVNDPAMYTKLEELVNVMFKAVLLLRRMEEQTAAVWNCLTNKAAAAAVAKANR